VLEELLTNAGLVETASGEVDCPFIYPDLATAWRDQSSIGPFRRAIEIVGNDLVRRTYIDALPRSGSRTAPTAKTTCSGTSSRTSRPIDRS
jgi:hypothetical protein